MRVKRYVVDSMPDALQKIRTDLGKDAVILNTKEIRIGGFLGMFSKKKIEVIAATDQAAPAPSPSKPSPILSKAAVASPNTASAVLSVAAVKTAGEQPQRQSSPQAAAAAGFNSFLTAQNAYARPSAPAPSSGGAAPASRKPADTAVSELAFPDVPDVLLPASPPAPPQPERAKPAAAAPLMEKSREDVLLEELKQVKEFMHKLSVQNRQPMEIDPLLDTIRQRLREQEIEPALVEEIMSAAAEASSEEETGWSEERLLNFVRGKLLEQFTIGESRSMSPDTRIVHFVGPTGVGKTTTIAKLAAEQVLKYNRKVGFITSDTYRIAAVEQLKTYATILNVPLEVVFSPQDLSKAYEQLQDRDLIFMDTAGRNYRNEMYVSELNALLRSQGKSETFLVLSLTTKYKDMKAITDNFSKFKLDKVLFTKLDETDSYGAVVNLVHDFKLQLSYVTHGQNVPDDITELDEQRILDLILGAPNYE